METPPTPNPDSINPAEPAMPPSIPAHSPRPAGHPATPEKRRNPWKIFGIIVTTLLVLLIAAGVWWWWVNRMPRPVVLTNPEIEVLEDKLTAVSGEPVVVKESQLEMQPEMIKTGDVPRPIDPILLEKDPEKRRDMMSDEDRRTIVFSEREVNGFINHNTGLADKVYLDFEDDVIVAKFAYTFEDDVPMVGGQMVKLRCHVGARLDENTRKLFLALQDVTINGIPVPNAWLGEIKNKNLFDQASDAEPTGFLKALSDGIEDIELRSNQLRVRLAP